MRTVTTAISLGMVLALSSLACSSDDSTGGPRSVGGKGDGFAVPLERGEPDDTGDAYTIESAHTEGNDLIVEVSYGGGCEDHEFRLFWDGLILESQPVQANLVLTHDGNNDFCEAIKFEVLRFDVSELAGDTIILNLQDGPSITFDGSATPTVQFGEPDGIGDGYVFEDARLEGDELVLDVSYGGGCEEHDFELFWDGKVLESLPAQVRLTLTHDGNDDFCESFRFEELRFGLGPLADLVAEGELILRFEDGPSVTVE